MVMMMESRILGYENSVDIISMKTCEIVDKSPVLLNSNVFYDDFR